LRARSGGTESPLLTAKILVAIGTVLKWRMIYAAAGYLYLAAALRRIPPGFCLQKNEAVKRLRKM
jgi:hypothetical protein